ncbi:hypothetical protein CGLO_10650 [Colletotrichum gloeosporioides Cg-14]|uniref:Uncharacterized protein n=1 Tax=Colletotrichum gloeosporioides (strain Cg-14) TaxID=1237896 RepID=T0K392_COLGC|nr:hypothetical protein CGLO_10650 [Colletotrichum gloeosporioides Cg-14]
MDHGEQKIQRFLESIKDAVFSAQKIYHHLRTLEASLVDNLKPCEVRRRLPDHVVSFIVSCLPEAPFTVNGIQNSPKLAKAARDWNLSNSHILFYIAYDYTIQGQLFFASLRDFAAATPDDWHSSFRLLRQVCDCPSCPIPTQTHRSVAHPLAIPISTSSTLLIASNPRSHTFGAKVNSDARTVPALFPRSQAVSSLYSPTLFNIVCRLPSIIPPAALPEASNAVLSDIVYDAQQVDIDVENERDDDEFDLSLRVTPGTGSHTGQEGSHDTSVPVAYQNVDENKDIENECNEYLNDYNYEDSGPAPCCSPRAPHTGNLTIGTTREESEAQEFEKASENASEAFSAVDTQNMSERGRKKRQRVDQPEIKPLAPADDLAALLTPGTGVSADLLHKTLSSFCNLSAPDVCLVDPTLILDMDEGHHEREEMIALGVYFSKTTILPLEVEENCWALAVIKRRNSTVTRIELFDSTPTAKYHNRAKALTDAFLDHYLPTTPASRRHLSPCAVPKHADEKDSGVFTFALVLHLMTQTTLPQQLTKSLVSAEREESLAICRAFESAPPADADLVARLEHAGQLIQAGKDWGTSTRARVEEIKRNALQIQTEARHAIDILDVIRDKAFGETDRVDDEMESHRQVANVVPMTKGPSMADLERDFETAEQMSFRVETTTVGLGLVLEDAERLVADVQKGLQDVQKKLHELTAFGAGAL